MLTFGDLETDEAREARCYSAACLKMLASVSFDSRDPEIRWFAHTTVVTWLCAIRRVLAEPQLSGELRDELEGVLRQFYDS
jgi:hypothetical protein